MHKQQGWPQAWEFCQAKPIQTLGSVHKEWTEAGVSASRVTTLRYLQEKDYQATSETETSSEASHLTLHFMLPSADKIYGDAEFLFWQDLAPRHSQHVWPEAHLDSMGFFSRERWETVDPTIKMSWRPKSASAEPQADRFHATAHWCWSLC